MEDEDRKGGVNKDEITPGVEEEEEEVGRTSETYVGIEMVKTLTINTHRLSLMSMKSSNHIQNSR
ncbi:hypothetical protein E2C01_095668 [Portunus trituberculatus]|uniref:Uncharacterized protein n=1 Tax=Portunus trituberculatus TaxID=210409 RepID=A0A5B7JZF4_PORTR|nr:hypothetical protein [Portunus trituberculatus]